MVALMCWPMAAGWIPPMRTHSVSIAAAAAALGAAQLKQPRGTTPRWQSARRRKSARPAASGGLAPASGRDEARGHPPGGSGVINLNGYCDRAFRDCGCGDHLGVGMARRDGANAAVPAGARREALLRFIYPVPRRSEPARA